LSNTNKEAVGFILAQELATLTLVTSCVIITKDHLLVFVIGWNIDSKVLMGRVRQATRDVVKSEV